MTDDGPAHDGAGSTRERLRAPLARVGWQAYEALLYLAGAAITILLHLGLMMLMSATGVVMQRLVIDVAVGADEESQLVAVTEAGTDAAVLTASVIIAILGFLKVVTRAWRDFRNDQ